MRATLRPTGTATAALLWTAGLTTGAAADAVDTCETAGYYDRMEQLAACTEVIEQGLWPRSDMAWVYSNRGNAYVWLDESELAIADYDAALEIDPDYAAAYSNRGAVYHRQGEYELAIADFDAALEHELPSNLAFIAHFNRGIAYCRLDDPAAAQADWAEARDAAGKRGRARMQLMLTQNGHNPGTFDGTWTDASQAALDAWAANGCP